MSCESFPVIAQSYHSSIGCQVPLSLDCIAIHPKYAVRIPKKPIILNGKIKNHHIPNTIQNNPIIQTTNDGTNLDLLRRKVAGPNKTMNKKTKDANKAKLAINFHPLWFPNHRPHLLHHLLHYYCMKNSSHHKESNLLHRLNLLRPLIQHLL